MAACDGRVYFDATSPIPVAFSPSLRAIKYVTDTTEKDYTQSGIAQVLCTYLSKVTLVSPIRALLVDKISPPQDAKSYASQP